MIRRNTARVKLLLQSGAREALTTVGGYRYGTALHLAALRGPEELVKLLVENSADIKAKDALRWTPLNIAIRERNTPATRSCWSLGQMKI
jgi:hypothetical protein